ncbi:MAG: bifunctional diguanylate cyclase/phosphodiesterase [Gammaproteobacteria bacterium]|nr:bifunctional diguanylate cyclase/phosphodiesterase [Gammaproteobacteria bacterium]
MIALLLISTLILVTAFKTFFSQPLEILATYLRTLKQNPKKSHTIPENTFYLKEFDDLKHSLHAYHQNLQNAQTELHHQNQLVWEQARRDVLTNIYNRRAFDETWNCLLELSINRPVATAYILFDCDYFKALNDTYGHDVGDEVIRVSATTIQAALPIDSPPYRIGGDEFAIIVQSKSREQVLEIATKCLKSLHQFNFNSIGIKEKLAFSVGISYADPADSNDFINDIISLPRQADIAMYKAKESLLHKIQCYTPKLEHANKSLVSSTLVSQIVEAVQSGRNIVMNFQPIQAVETDQLYFESLIRMEGDNGIIYPTDIFAVVQRRRLEVEMDVQIIQQVYKAMQANKIPRHTGVAINVSGKTLLQSNFVSLFKDFIPLLKQYKIVIEVTENTLIDHMEYAQSVLNELREQGFLIALDDFGSGYSSIKYLAHMPVDIIKFDMSMTVALNSDEKTINIIKSTAEMVRRSGYDLVLEGIEDTDLMSKSIEAGATHLQGYLLGRPSPDAICPPSIAPDSSTKLI